MPQLQTKSFSRGAACAVVLAAVWLLFPARATAIPISEYQQRVNDAIGSLQTLIRADDDQVTSEYETELNQAINEIRAGLPVNLTVESDGQTYNVDNSWLHKALEDLKSPASRSEEITQLIESLEAMNARLDDRQGGSQPLESKDAANNRLKGILTRPEYVSAARGPNALTRLLRDFFEWLKNLFPKPKRAEVGSMTWLARVAQVLVILAALMLVGFLLKLLFNRLKRTKRIKPRRKQEPRIVLGERLAPEQTATDLLSEAEALARSGDLRAAIRKAYIALLVELGDRKIISLAQHKTNRDYLNGLRELPPLHSRMTGLTQSFERHWYGFVEATQSDWQNFRDGYLAALHRGN